MACVHCTQANGVTITRPDTIIITKDKLCKELINI